MDIVFVLDTSNSMQRSMKSEHNVSNLNRLYYAKNAIRAMASEVLAGGNDTRVSLVTFDGGKGGKKEKPYDDATIRQQGTANADRVSWALGQIGEGKDGGGTNWEAGLREAQSLLGTAREGADTYVVFISDGNAGYYYDENGRTQGQGQVTAGQINQTAYQHAVTLANQLDAEIISVGVGPQENVDHLVGFARDVNGPYYSGASEKDLNDAVSSILQTITRSQTYRGVSIVDTLSEYVALPEGAVDENGVLTGAQIKVTDKDGNDVTSQIQDSSSWKLVQQKDGSLRVNFGDNYELVDGYTYTVSFQVVPTQKAYDDTYAEGDQDSSTPGFDSAGLPSNNSARVEYSIVKTENDKNEVILQDPVDYNKPTFTVPMSQLTITKRWDGKDVATPDKVQIAVKQDSNDKFASVELNEDNKWSATVYVPAGPVGHTYSVAEPNPGDGWTCQSVSDAVKLTGLTAQTEEFTVTNVPEMYTLWVEKVDASSQEPLHNAKFALYREGEDGGFVQNEDHFIANGEIGTEETDTHAVFKNLTPGTYYLVETYVPAGYQLNDEPYRIEVTADGIEFASSEHGDAQAARKVDGVDRTYQVSFENTKAAGGEIPSTGGMGDVPLYAAGVMAIAGSVTAVRKIKRH